MFRWEGMNLNITQIQYFIEVANSKSFTQAALNLHTAHSTISKSIALLEQTLNMQLFIRSRKQLVLTEAGQHLFNEWRAALAHMELSIEECRGLSGGYKDNLVISVLDTHKSDAYMLPTIRAFQAKYPRVNIRVETCGAPDVRRNTINGLCDLGFTVLYDIEQRGTEGLEYKVVRKCPYCVAMRNENPLAQKSILKTEDLAESNFIGISPWQLPSYTEIHKELFMSASSFSRFSCYTTSAGALVYNLATPNDVFLCDEYYTEYGNPYISWRPLDAPSSGIVAIWPKGAGKKQVHDFLSCLFETCGWP